MPFLDGGKRHNVQALIYECEPILGVLHCCVCLIHMGMIWLTVYCTCVRRDYPDLWSSVKIIGFCGEN